MTLRSCRTLPGHGKRWQSCSASADIRLRRRLCLAVNCSKNRSISSGMSSARSRNGGMTIGTICKPVEQVLAELPAGHRLLELLVRGGDDPHIDADQLRPADHPERAVLQHAQQVPLPFGRQVADLVQEQRAPVRQLEPPRLVGDGAR